jgi:RNA polymerase sigma-70 factor (ECF subfamily)
MLVSAHTRDIPRDPGGADRPPEELRERQERFLALLLPASERLARYARAMTGDREEAYDVEAETLLAAWERFDAVRAPEAFASFLFTIASRIAKRRRWRRRLWSAFDESLAESIIDTRARADVSHDVGLLYEEISRLPAAQREAIVLFELTGFSIAEIRQIQGGTLSGVKTRLARARRKLAAALGAATADDSPSARPAAIAAQIRTDQR